MKALAKLSFILLLGITACNDEDGKASTNIVEPLNESAFITILAPKTITAGSWAQLNATIESQVDIANISWESSTGVNIKESEQTPHRAVMHVPYDFSGTNINLSVNVEDINGQINTETLQIDIVDEKPLPEYVEDIEPEQIENALITHKLSDNSTLTPANRNDDGYSTVIASPENGLLFEPRLGSLLLVGGTPSDIQVGDIIVGVTEDMSKGFMRRVLSIHGDTYVTEIASFVDAFPNAELSLNLIVSNGTAQTTAQISPSTTDQSVEQMNDFVLLDYYDEFADNLGPGVNSSLYIDIYSAIEVDFDISVFQAKVNRLATIAKAEYDMGADVSLAFEEERELFSLEKKFNPIVDQNIIVYIYGIPVLINLKLIPEIEVDAGISGAVNLKYGVRANGDYRSGFEYSEEKLKVIDDFVPVTQKIGPNYNVSGAMSTKAGSELNVVLSFYEFSIPFSDEIIDGPGVGVEVGPYAEFTVEVELDDIEQIIECALALNLGVAAEAELDYGFVGQILDLSPSNRSNSYELYDTKFSAWQNKEICDFMFGHLAGSVRSIDGDYLPNASIEMQGLNNGENPNLFTGSDGLFLRNNLPIGNYLVSISQPGFRSEQLTVSIRDDETSQIDAFLIPRTSEDPIDEVDEQGNSTKAAIVTGDPHLRTFDGLSYDFQGVGEYVMAQSNTDDFAIQGRFVPVDGSNRVSLNSAVAVNLEGTRVAIYKAETGLALLLDGQLVEWDDGSHILSNGANINKSEGVYTLYWADHSRAKISRRGQFVDVEVTLNNRRIGTINGVLGFFDGSLENELTTAFGEALNQENISNFNQLYDVYGESWRVTADNTLFDYFDNESLEGFVDRNFPSSLVTQARLQEQLGQAEYQRLVELCQHYVTNMTRLNACVIDVALTGISDGLNAYRNIAHPLQELDLPIPPDMRLVSPSAGDILSSNVLISGSIDSEANIENLTLSINGGPEEDISFSLSEKSFQLTQSANKFVEGQNSLVLFATDINGNRGNTRRDFIFDSKAAPPAGSDVIVINDVNMFDGVRINGVDNVKFSENLVNFSTDLPRSSGTTIWWDLSHASKCDANCLAEFDFSKLTSVWENLGYNTVQIHEAELIKSIPLDVKLIILWTPMQDYSALEIQYLKSFASAGGRILFVGENEDYYQMDGIEVENNFLQSMGALMRNIGEARYGGDTYFMVNPGNKHQIVEEVENVQGNLVSLLELGPNDYPLLLSNNGQDVIAAVARVDINIQSVQAMSGSRSQFNEYSEESEEKTPSPIIFTSPAQN